MISANVANQHDGVRWLTLVGAQGKQAGPGRSSHVTLTAHDLRAAAMQLVAELLLNANSRVISSANPARRQAARRRC